VDVCELASQLMEYWVRDPATLQQLARHHRTGEPMPAGLARGAVAGLTMFRALDVRQQARNAALCRSPPQCTNSFTARQNITHCVCGDEA